MNALKKIIQTAEKDLNPRYRDRRAHYASDSKTCIRDQYWELTGEKSTNPPDFLGRMKMLVGKAVEEQLVANLIRRAHHVGLHHIADQVQIGLSSPVKVDGSLDCLVYEAGPDETPYVIEIKTKSGWGADNLKQTFDPGVNYLAQLGIYLKDLSQKKVTNTGCFIFVLLSDNSFGEMIQINCRYMKGKITAYEAVGSWGETRAIDYTLTDEEMFKHFLAVEKALKEKKAPSPSYQYKAELTPEFLASVSDYQLKAAINGQKILGDWQPRYSRFFDKQLAVDNQVREYTPEEIALLKREYNSRLTPTGRKRKAI